MPYKDKGKAREKSKERMRKHRSVHSEGVVTPDDVTPRNVTPDVTPDVKILTRPNMIEDGAVVFKDNEYDPEERIYGNPFYKDGTLRYLPLDGQVLDRLNVKQKVLSGVKVQSIRSLGNTFKPNQEKGLREKVKTAKLFDESRKKPTHEELKSYPK